METVTHDGGGESVTLTEHANCSSRQQAWSQERGRGAHLWFSSRSAGDRVFFCFRCSMTAFCFITT